MGVEQTAPRARSVGAEVARVAAFFAATLIGSLIGRATYLESVQVVLISPLAGLSYLWLASGSPRREWWWDVPALSLASVCTVLLVHGPSAQVWSAILITWVQPVATVLVMRRLVPDLWGSGGRRALSQMRDFASFLVACAVGALLSSLLRWWGLGLVMPLDATGFGMTLIRNVCWVLAIGLLGLQVAPLLPRVRDTQGWRELVRSCLPASRWHVLEAVVIVATTAGLYVVAFDLPVTFAISLVTVWAALRFSPVTAELHAFASGTTALLLTLAEVGVFADVTGQLAGAALGQAFMIMLVVTAAVVGLSAQARRQATAWAIESEREAAARAHLLDSVLDNMNEGLVVVQDDGQILVRNPAGRRLIGLEGFPVESSVQSASTYGLHRLDGTPLPDDEMPTKLAFEGVEVVEQDYLLRTPRFPAGRILEMSVTHIPVAVQDGHRQAIINFRDVTRARQDRDNLASFAGVVAHDLINPLSIVDGWAEALNEAFLEGPVEPADGGAMVTRIQTAAVHMRQFIDDLLGYAVARDHPMRLDDLDLSRLIEDVAALRREDDVRPRIHVQPGLLVRGDASMLRQLVDNLLSNAIKYVAPGVRPHIIVSGHTEDGLVCLTVDDNGIGVPVEHRRSVFENFHRAATEYSGTGIGLAICARIVERHGGTITVDDNPHGEGSRFTFTLPQAAVPEPLPDPPGEATLASAELDQGSGPA